MAIKIGGTKGEIYAVIIKEILDFMIEKCLNKKNSKVQQDNKITLITNNYYFLIKKCNVHLK